MPRALYYACERGLGFFGYSGAFWHYGGPVEGGQSEIVRVPFADSTLVPVPEELTDPDRRPAVVGVIDVMGTGWHGAVGLCAAHAAAARGAERVILAGHHADRLAIGRRLGATDVLEPATPARPASWWAGSPAATGRAWWWRACPAPSRRRRPTRRARRRRDLCIGLDRAVGAPPEVDHGPVPAQHHDHGRPGAGAAQRADTSWACSPRAPSTPPPSSSTGSRSRGGPRATG